MPSVLRDIAHLEKNVFVIKGKTVRFEFSEIPNDMKMLCFLGGELSNSAEYFSSFGNVTNKDMSNIKFTFGSCQNNEWQPWDYDERLNVAKQVKIYKKKLTVKMLQKKLNERTLHPLSQEKNPGKNMCQGLES